MTNENDKSSRTDRASGANRSIRGLVTAAEQAEEAGNVELALERWREVVGRERDEAWLCRLGRVAMHAHGYDEAKEALLMAVEMAPDSPWGYRSLALLHSTTGDREDCITYCTKTLAIEKSPAIYTLLGAAQLGLGKVDRAQESFMQAIEIDATYEEAYYNLGASIPLEDPAVAISLFRKAVELDPNYAIALCELGWALNRQGEYDDAETYLQRSVRIDPSDEVAWVYLGNVFWRKKELKAAENALHRAVEARPDSSLVHWCLAMFYEYNDDPNRAHESYETAYRLDPEDPGANFRFGMILKELGEFDRAVRHFKAALTAEPDMDLAQRALAELESTRDGDVPDESRQ